MSSQKRRADRSGEGGERSEPPSPGAPGEPVAVWDAAEADLPPSGTPAGEYTAAERVAALRAYARSGQTMSVWCRARGLTTSRLCAWRRAYEAGGGDDGGPSRGRQRQFTPEERRAAVSAHAQSGMSQVAFARLWGISDKTLSRWVSAHRRAGPRGLERPWGEGPRGRRREPVPEAVRAGIVAVKTASPWFGLRRIRDELARVLGLRVGLHRVREVVAGEGLAPAVPAPRPRRGPPVVRRFERSRPRELWQSDLTSYVLARHGQRAYLTVFLDDHSRYVVAWALALQQRGELVCGCLLEGVSRFGKPREVLTDQGRQYYAWRGRSAFQKLLLREGIEHVVARAHHPQTLGKCERLWQTVGEELWERARPQDLEDARRRLGHFFAHYNHFRPHQGIGGLVPADRFFGAETKAREALESQMDRNALRLALGEAPRRPVFLYGQIGDEALCVHGERGRLVIQRPGGAREEIALESLGGEGGHDDDDERAHGRDGGHAAAPPAAADGAVCAAAADARGGARAVALGEPGGADCGARAGAGAPGAVAGDAQQGGGGGGARGDPSAGVADEPGGAVRPGVRAPAAAADAAGPGGDDDGRRGAGGPAGAAAGAGAHAAGAGGGAAADRGAAGAAGQRAADAGGGEARRRDGGGRHVATPALPRPPERPGELSPRPETTPTPETPSPPPSRTSPAQDEVPWWESVWGAGSGTPGPDEARS